MNENAELWVHKGNERVTIENWLMKNKIEYDKNLSIENLIQIYRDIECKKYIKEAK